MIHYHKCPECYEVWKCDYLCTMEPDQDDPDTYPDYQFGAITKCPTCDPPFPPDPVDKYKTKEFWDVYNGFVKVKKKKYVV